MRKLWAAGAAIVVCLALGAMPALAQVYEEAVVVTATQACTWAGGIGTCTATASDPRVTGPLTLAWTFEVGAPATSHLTAAMEATIQGPDGTWTGYQYATWDLEGTAHALAVLTGDGAYEGWTYVFSADDTSGTASFDSVGTMHQGLPPPPWEMPTAASE